MLLGDSITQGDKRHVSYRYPLWKKLVAANAHIDLVGTQRDNFQGNPSWPKYQGQAFDRDHEGYWGWRTDEVLSQVDGWLRNHTPDIVLLHLGSNDMFHDNTVDSTVDELRTLVDRLRAANPTVAVLMAQLIPADRQNAQITQLNARIVELASEMNTDASPVMVVDHNTGFNVSDHTYDGIHPNARGEEIMATRWLDALLASQVLGQAVLPSASH
ncbi:MAG TPA: cellulose-binding protein [Gammaproteobacteria bacterium]|nr:cellulose-binding protein [Gammaproteobacteria bacterium]